MLVSIPNCLHHFGIDSRMRITIVFPRGGVAWGSAAYRGEARLPGKAAQVALAADAPYEAGHLRELYHHSQNQSHFAHLMINLPAPFRSYIMALHRFESPGFRCYLTLVS
jgi:hypothetical protein